MGENVDALDLSAKKVTALGLASCVLATAFLGLATTPASADVTEVAPRPNVTSRQAQVVDQNALRRTSAGQARGSLADNRSSDEGTVRSGNGQVKDSVKAVPGTTAAPFNLTRKGVFRQGAPIGSW